MHRIAIHHALITNLRTALAEAGVPIVSESASNGWTTVDIRCDDATAAELNRRWWVESI